MIYFYAAAITLLNKSKDHPDPDQVTVPWRLGQRTKAGISFGNAIWMGQSFAACLPIHGCLRSLATPMVPRFPLFGQF
jgi:hypothetical protein